MKQIKSILELLENKAFLLIALILVFLLLIRQCGVTEEAERKAEREFRNYLASQDSVTHLKSKYGNVLAQKSAYELRYNELSDDHRDLIKRLELEKNKKPEVIIETEIVYRDTNIFVIASNRHVGDSSFITFSYNPVLPGTNRLLISGDIPYTFTSDSTILPGRAILTLDQKIDLVTGLYRDPETNQLKIRASTTFPGITFSQIESIDIIDSPSDKEQSINSRKPFGFGVSLGYGIVFNQNGYYPGPFLGLGLSYSPKWAQFGK
jgi:hypothetical protein